MKKILLAFILISIPLSAMTLKISFFDDDGVEAFQSYLTNNQIPVTNEIVMGPSTNKIIISGPFNEYDICRIWNAVELIKKCLPMVYKTTDLIYFEIYLALDGKMDHVNLALKEMQLFPIYLNSYNYLGAIDCVNKASKYLTPNEKNAILSIIPQN